MINRTLHAITNRAMFNSDTLLDSSYSPHGETTASRQLRSLLGLDRTQDDYHVFAVLAAIEAYPDIVAAFEDPIRSYETSDYSPPAPVFSGGAPISDANGVYRCQLVVTEAPVPASFTFTWIDARFGALRYGNRREVLPVSVMSSFVYPEWPEQLGFSGGIDTTWASGAVFQVDAYPARFPYEVMAANLQNADCKNGFLLQHGLLDHFHFASTSMEKVAVTALALGLSNPVVYG
jgi:hypothetical protein